MCLFIPSLVGAFALLGEENESRLRHQAHRHQVQGRHQTVFSWRSLSPLSLVSPRLLSLQYSDAGHQKARTLAEFYST